MPIYDGDQPPEQRIRFRIGINIAGVIAQGTDLHGNGVNIAARLEAESPVGGVCVTRAVLRARLGLTGRRWFIERRPMEPVIRTLLRSVDPLFRHAWIDP